MVDAVAAPLPDLRRIVGEGRGLGINLLAVVQASAQNDTVYGQVYAQELHKIWAFRYRSSGIELLP